jgi:hydroxymethylbilane synthase
LLKDNYTIAAIMAGKKIVIGTRKSRLAQWQTYHVKALLERAHAGLTIEIKEIITSGDRISTQSLPSIGGKGLFTAELEQALENQSIDIAVHSLKDLPTTEDTKFVLGAICEREEAHDALVSVHMTAFANLRQGAVIGTSSLRRASQLKRLRSDLEIRSIRGNVDTRLAKLTDATNGYDAIVIAEAGITRIGRKGEITQLFTFDDMLPAPGQGALAVQCASARADVRTLLAAIDHCKTHVEVTAERAFLHGLDAGCSTPVAALATLEGERLSLKGRALNPCGARMLEDTAHVKLSSEALSQAHALGADMATRMLKQGFTELLDNSFKL